MIVPGAAPVYRRVRIQGLECHEVALPDGDHVRVAEHGGHVLSWKSAGRERLYLSPSAVLDGRAAVRGGIPVCWPQFSDRGPLPRHGWLRVSPWCFQGASLETETAALRFTVDPAAVRPSGVAWSADCEVTLLVSLAPGALTLRLTVHNRGPQPLLFTGALHTYLALDDAESATVSGWSGEPSGWDAVRGHVCETVPRLGLRGEIDRILPAAAQALRVDDGSQSMLIEQDGWSDTVVWNPGAEKCAGLPDMPAGDERRMACVEAAQVFQPVELAPGAEWTGRQRLHVVRPH